MCAVCKNQGLNFSNTPNILHVENASDLTSISISLTELMRGINGKKFIFIDSINSMLIHNSPDIFSKFIHSLLIKMRSNLTSGVLIILKDNSSEKVYDEIALLCDKIIKI